MRQGSDQAALNCFVMVKRARKQGGKKPAEKQTGRLEAFSDGVFAIAITLLVLDIHVPHAESLGPGHGLLRALGEQWPTYLAYVTSFLTILIMWMNHHAILENIGRSDQRLQLFNGLLLMVISLVPFPTSLLAEYLRDPAGERAAAAVYSAFFVLLSVAFNLVWRDASHNGRLLHAGHDPMQVTNITRRYQLGPFLYLATFGLAFVNVWASVGLCLALAAFFARPGR